VIGSPESIVIAEMGSGSPDRTPVPVAIVGIGCRFPGGVVDPETFWQLLIDGVDAITDIPRDRMAIDRYYDPRPAVPGRIMTRWGGFLTGIDEFDAAFFGISPREAERMDPQQRLLLETAWEALEDAGVDVGTLEGSSTSVFVGQWLSDFEGRLFADPENADFYMTTGSGRYSASGRISYALGLRGASLTIDTACSSSLVAAHLAVRSIRSGESTMALAGGVNVILQPHISIAYSQSRMMAPDGRCKFGDASGDGYVRSEGAALIALKSLPRALADGDRIYAVIRGSAVNNDGRSSGSMGTPSRVGQEELLRRAYADAGVAPSRVGYFEAHGTGTRAGDPVEVGALGAVLGDGGDKDRRAYVGSVKTNFGHTEGAAGIAGLIKVALALHHRTIPKSLHCHELNPGIPWAEMPLQIAREAVPWNEPINGVRLGGVSAFGIAGTNAHVVLEEVECSPTGTDSPVSSGVAVLPLSAKSPEALRALAGRYRELLGDERVSVQDVCWGAATRRTALDHRAVVVGADRASLSESLRAYANGEGLAVEGRASQAARPRIAFVCPGQGAQWVGMARDLAAQAPVFRAALEQCDQAARPYVSWSILAQLKAQPGTSDYLLDQIDVIQPVLVSLSIAYAQMFRSLGIEAAAVVGHSMGEVAAAHIAGVLTLDQAMRIICRRSALMRTTSGRGAMALVELSMDEARARIEGKEAQIAVAVSNSPRSSVISGAPDAVQQVVSELERDGVFCRLVKVDVASHSPQMHPLAETLAAELTGMVTSAATIPIFSTVLARRAEGHEFGASYWSSNLRNPVLFADAVRRMLDEGVTAFVELGPHPVLLPSVQQTAQAFEQSVVTVSCGRRDEPEWINTLGAVGTLWATGYPIDWRGVLPRGTHHVTLPLQPWQRERHWIDLAELAPTGSDSRRARIRVDDEMLGWLYRLEWTAAQRNGEAAVTAEPWLVVSETLDDAEVVARAATTVGAHAIAVSPDELGRAIVRGSASTIVYLAGDRDAAYAPVQLVQSVLAARGQARLWFVTRGAHVVDARDRRVSAEQSALWGAARVVAEEHPDLWGGLIDLEATATATTSAARIAGHIASAGEDQVAFRGDDCFTLRLTAIPRQAATTLRAVEWRHDAAYLITGGLGDIGLHVARTMAAGGARRLVLLGRTPLPPRESWKRLDPGDPAAPRAHAILELESRGVAVHTAAVDVSDESQLQAFLDRYAKEAWPEIRGVVHAAGVLDNALAANMDRATFDRVVRGKLEGARLLDRLLPDLDLFVLFSSTGAFLAQPGQANYAAANAGLDGLAHDRRARGQHALSIQWAVWQNTGLVRGHVGEQNVGEMHRQGLRPFTADQGTMLFSLLTGSSDATVTVLPMDWSAYARARSGRALALFRRVMDSSADTTAGTELTTALSHADGPRRRQLLEGLIRETVGRVLKIAPARLDSRKAMGEMGLNSLMAMELRNRLEAALGRSLSATLAWNYPTIDALVRYLAGAGDQHQPVQPAESTPTNAAPADVSDSLRSVNELSDEEAALALRSRP
jgi:phthiocerol/phenolphthiocerol synthesis type-I polyketide synthase B